MRGFFVCLFVLSLTKRVVLQQKNVEVLRGNPDITDEEVEGNVANLTVNALMYGYQKSFLSSVRQL
jgi:hypothetical protein